MLPHGLVRTNHVGLLHTHDRKIQSVASEMWRLTTRAPPPPPPTPPPRLHGCGLFDAVEADPGGGRGDGHGSGHAHAEAVVVLPAVPPLPDGRTHLQSRGEPAWNHKDSHVKKNFQDYDASSPAGGIE